jgi:hypothetical protein
MALPFYTGQIPTADDFNALMPKADLSASSGSSLVGYSQEGTGTVERTVEDKLQETVTPDDFFIPGEVDYTAAFQRAIDNFKRPGLDLSTSSSAAAALADIPLVVIDLAGKTYTISSSLDFADLYYVKFENGRITADADAAWGDDFMLYIAKPQANDIHRDQKIRNLTFESVVIDGNLAANCIYLENTYEVTLKDSTVIGWKDGGYGVRTSSSSGTPKTKNTHLKLLNVTASQKELAVIAIPSIASSGTAFSIRTADFMLNDCTAFACDVAFDIDEQFNGQIVNCHGFVKSTQYCLKLGPNSHDICITNFYSDTGLVELRSFTHILNGCIFVANSQMQLIATSPNEQCVGLNISNSLFSKQPEFLTEDSGTWSTTPRSEWSGNRLTTGAFVRGRGRVLVCRGTQSEPSIKFNDDDVVDTATGFYSPAVNEFAYSANGTMAFTIDSQGRVIYGHSSSITQVGSSAPKVQLHGTTLNAATAASTRWNSTAGAANGGGGQVAIGRSRSAVIGSYAALENGDGLGRISFFGDNGTSLTQIGASVSAIAAGTWDATSAPTDVIFKTVPTGSTSESSRLAIRSTGDVDNLTGVYQIAGTQVVGPQETGWTAATGTPNKGAYATYAGQTVSASYDQAEAQATDDATKANSQRIKAIEDALRTHGLIN